MAYLKKFLSYYRPYLKTLASVLAAAVAAALISLLYPLCTRSITKSVLTERPDQIAGRILATGAWMLALLLIQTLCNFYQDYRGHVLGARMEHDIREELFGHYQKLSLRFFDGEKVGGLMSRLTGDLLSLTELYHHGPEDLAIYLVRFIGAFVILCHVNVKLTMITFAFLPVLALYTVCFSGKMRAAVRISRARIGDVNAQAEETLSGIRVVKSFTNENMEREKFARENERFFESRKKIYGCEAWFYQGIDVFIQLISIAVVVFGGVFIAGASLDVADLLTFLLYIGYMTEPIQKLMHIIEQYQEGFAGFDRFLEIMNMEPEIQDSFRAASTVPARPVLGNIEFRDVGFRYGAREEDVLSHISLTARVGDYVALVGHSGVGKTTLCSLIPRFYEATAGEILLDGVNVRDLPLDTLRKSIGVVQQEIYLFSGSVLDNIRYGKPDAAREEVIRAAVDANAHDFIMRLPQQYDTQVGQRGVRLSGGQKQRISIARVFLKDPPILIFDEATSALDNESELVIKESLEKLSRTRTTFVIAHRLSTIRNAKRILVMKDHGVAEQGTHDELMARNGIYARLYQCRVHA